jgi:membrane-bound ClpP family serine protease
MTVILATIITLFQLELEKTKALGNIFGVGGVVAIVLGNFVLIVNQMVAINLSAVNITSLHISLLFF